MPKPVSLELERDFSWTEEEKIKLALLYKRR